MRQAVEKKNKTSLDGVCFVLLLAGRRMGDEIDTGSAFL